MFLREEKKAWSGSMLYCSVYIDMEKLVTFILVKCPSTRYIKSVLNASISLLSK